MRARRPRSCRAPADSYAAHGSKTDPTRCILQLSISGVLDMTHLEQVTPLRDPEATTNWRRRRLRTDPAGSWGSPRQEISAGERRNPIATRLLLWSARRGFHRLQRAM